MQLRIEPNRRRWAILGAVLVAVAVVVLLRRPIAQVAELILGAAAACFVVAPLANLLEKRLSRPAAALAALLAVLAVLAGGLLLLLPALLREMADLARTLPGIVSAASNWLAGARLWLEQRLPGIRLPGMDFSALQGFATALAGGTITFAANLADVAGKLSMAAVLAYFFLRDRDRLLLRLELLMPQAWRVTAVRMASAASRELRLYLQGQLMIAGAVAALAVAALAIVGVRNALVLGLLVGVLNMIPYFGPFIGGVPAVLIALTESWQKAALTAAALVVVQQLDGSWISPRVMGSLTGFSPAAVLLGIYGGARLGGVLGMLLALPAMMTTRTLFRVFVQKYENI